MSALLRLFILLSLTASICAQEQEQNMLERIQNPKLEASRLQDKAFSGDSGFKARSFETQAFSGTKAAPIKTFEARSFLGIKNPWFGKKVFETDASSFASREAREAESSFFTKSANTKTDRDAGKSAGVSEVLPQSVAPRATKVEPKAQGSVDQFTQNLSEDLTIDDIRALLNKGQSTP